tara:strand:- start:652 stop:3486 length:2835 start_codon:yes stop_codon:yes gene_type:complete
MMARDSLLGQDFFGALGQSVGQDLTREREERERRYERPSFADTLKAQAMSSVATAITAPIGQAIGGFVTEPFKRLEDNFVQQQEKRKSLKTVTEFSRKGNELIEQERSIINEAEKVNMSPVDYLYSQDNAGMLQAVIQKYGQNWRTQQEPEIVNKIEVALIHAGEESKSFIAKDWEEIQAASKYFQDITAGNRSIEEIKTGLRRYNPYPRNLGAAALRSTLNFLGIDRDVTDAERERRAFKKAAPGWHDILFNEEGKEKLNKLLTDGRGRFKRSASDIEAIFTDATDYQTQNNRKNLSLKAFHEDDLENASAARSEYIIDNFPEITKAIGLSVNEEDVVTVENPDVYRFITSKYDSKSFSFIESKMKTKKEDGVTEFDTEYANMENDKNFKEAFKDLSDADVGFLTYKYENFKDLPSKEKYNLIQEHLGNKENNLLEYSAFKDFKNLNMTEQQDIVNLIGSPLITNDDTVLQASVNAIASLYGIQDTISFNELRVQLNEQNLTNDAITRMVQTQQAAILNATQGNLRTEAAALVSMMRRSDDEQIEQYYTQTGQRNARELFTSAVEFLAGTKQLDVDTQRYSDNIFEDETILTEFYNFLTKKPVPVTTDDPKDIATQIDADTGTRYNLSSDPVTRENQTISVVRMFVNELPSDVSKEEIRNKVMRVADSVGFNDNVSTTLSPFIVSGVREVSGESITVEATPNSVDIGRPHALYGGRRMATRGSTPEQVLEDISEDTLNGRLVRLHIEHAAGNYSRIYSELKNQGLSDAAILSSGYGSFKYSVSKENVALKKQLQAIRNSVDLNRIDITSHEFLLAVAPKEAEVNSEPTTNSMLAQTSEANIKRMRSSTSDDNSAPIRSLLGITDEEMDEIDAAAAAQSSQDLVEFFIDKTKNVLRPKKAELFTRFVNTDELSPEEYLRIAEEIGLDNRDVGGLLTILANNESV